MAEIEGKELRIARETVKMPRWKVAREMNVSESVVERWESDECTPHPDQVYQLEQLYSAQGLWHGWMRSHYESYRAVYPERREYKLPLAVINMRHQIADIMALQDSVERDVMDGKMDDMQQKAHYRRKIDEAMSALVQVKQLLAE